jgi:hypothetical protein
MAGNRGYGGPTFHMLGRGRDCREVAIGQRCWFMRHASAPRDVPNMLDSACASLAYQLREGVERCGVRTIALPNESIRALCQVPFARLLIAARGGPLQVPYYSQGSVVNVGFRYAQCAHAPI